MPLRRTPEIENYVDVEFGLTLAGLVFDEVEEFPRTE